MKAYIGDMVTVPSHLLPAVRAIQAHNRGCLKNILVMSEGGLGDRVCAEPTIRYMIEHFKDCEISLMTYSEDVCLYDHLKFKEIFTEKNPAMREKFLIMNTYHQGDHFSNQFFNSALMNGVDYASVCAIRGMLPIADKEVRLPEFKADMKPEDNWIFVHPGRSWQSKTLPVDFWNCVITDLIRRGLQPVLIGADYNGKGFSDVCAADCVDLRNRTPIRDLMALLRSARVLLTNDSSPLHLAAVGNCWIGMIATARHPDFCMHWRQGEFGWRMQNFSRGCFSDIEHCGPKEKSINFDKVDPAILQSWLPEPKIFAEWAEMVLNTSSY